LPTSSINFNPPVIAHRGANYFAPENTLAAFSRVKALGVSWIEFDVMLAASGEAVVIHDETLERTTTGKGNVADFPLSYLETLDAGSWFDPKFLQEKIPTFKSVIDLIRRDGLSANVEIKAQPGQEAVAVKNILRDIQAEWTADMSPPLVSSFSLPILQWVRKMAPKIHIGVLIDEWYSGWEQTVSELQATSVNLNQEIVDVAIVRQIHAMGKLVLCYTVNSAERAKQLFDWGVDAVFSDRVDLVLNVV
jgi:glycerophosphoryl diester phosphodiesterase